MHAKINNTKPGKSLTNQLKYYKQVWTITTLMFQWLSLRCRKKNTLLDGTSSWGHPNGVTHYFI